MAYLNETRIIGNVGNDVKAGVTRGGAKYAAFNVAVTKKRKNKEGQKIEKTTWYPVICWNHSAVFAAQYVKKGDQVFVGGELTDRPWQDNNGQKRITKELLGENIQITRSKNPNNGQAATPQPANSNSGDFGTDTPVASAFDQTPPPQNFNQTPVPVDEDLPF